MHFKWKSDLVKELHGASVRVEKLTKLGNESMLMDFVKGGKRYRVSISFEEILEISEEKEKRQRKIKPRLNRTNVFSSKKHWDVEILKAERLPLYWNKDWIISELDSLGSYEKIAKAYNYSAHAMSEFCKKRWGIKCTKGRNPGHSINEKTLKELLKNE